jgi:hypothetical protein
MPRKTRSEYSQPWYGTDKFKKLAKKWHDKLEKSGFVDAEEFDSPLELMKQNHNFSFKKFSPKQIDERMRYFELARQLLHDYPFADDKEKRVWESHSEGSSDRVIAKTLGYSEHSVKKIVKKLKVFIKQDAKETIENMKLAKTGESNE